MSTILAGARLVTPEGIVDKGWCELDEARIVALGTGVPPRAPDLDLGGGYLSPGFVDIHTHGGGGASVIGADAEAVSRFAEAHLRHGTTTILASLVAAHPEPLAADVAALAELTEQGVIAGTHIEGPWISPTYKGAHNLATLRDPDVAEVDRILALGRGTVRMVTLAPE